LAAVDKASAEPLFAAAIDVDVLALPHETAWVEAPDVDTGVPSQLAKAAKQRAPQARCVVVAGKHAHVSFLLDPDPIRVRIVDVAPPYPAKLVDQAGALLDVADDLPPVEIVPDVIDLERLAASRPAEHYLFPCRVSGLRIEGAQTSYLDERPPEADWVLVGCARSREIHRWCYGKDAPYVEMCPRRLATPSDTPTMTKCCLLEEEAYERVGQQVTLPWGASLSLVRAALTDLVTTARTEQP
jgi:hypothetical protein